ncbi:hypothetical protein DYB31_009995 [Aphanomyces astaci]|uniref:DUF7769 domain-containing protein n=1 Tax=Aphanomyces astaci TaxID=112090 RepID=A0A397FDG9_APHAT|nr:hypothetical protein DYB31_009995 [Aphanomyces astaci]
MLKGQKKKNPTDSECNSMVQHLLLRCTKAGKIPMGAADEVAQLFDCTPSTVRRIWRRASVNLSGSKTICRNVNQRKKSTCGRKRLHKDLPKRIQAIPQSRRYCFRSLAHALGMPKSTLHDYFKRGVFAKYSSNFLTLQRCLQEVILNKGGNDYKIPHMRKDVLHARGKLPEMVSCDRDAWSFGCAYLDGADYSAHMHKLSLEILQSMEMSAFCSQIEALNIVDDTDADDNLVAALGLVELSYE